MAKKGKKRNENKTVKGVKQQATETTKKHWTDYVSLIFSGIRVVEGWDKFVERVQDLLSYPLKTHCLLAIIRNGGFERSILRIGFVAGAMIQVYTEWSRSKIRR